MGAGAICMNIKLSSIYLLILLLLPIFSYADCPNNPSPPTCSGNWGGLSLQMPPQNGSCTPDVNGWGGANNCTALTGSSSNSSPKITICHKSCFLFMCSSGCSDMDPSGTAWPVAIRTVSSGVCTYCNGNSIYNGTQVLCAGEQALGENGVRNASCVPVPMNAAPPNFSADASQPNINSPVVLLDVSSLTAGQSYISNMNNTVANNTPTISTFDYPKVLVMLNAPGKTAAAILGVSFPNGITSAAVPDPAATITDPNTNQSRTFTPSLSGDGNQIIITETGGTTYTYTRTGMQRPTITVANPAWQNISPGVKKPVIILKFRENNQIVHLTIPDQNSGVVFGQPAGTKIYGSNFLVNTPIIANYNISLGNAALSIPVMAKTIIQGSPVTATAGCWKQGSSAPVCYNSINTQPSGNLLSTSFTGFTTGQNFSQPTCYNANAQPPGYFQAADCNGQACNYLCLASYNPQMPSDYLCFIPGSSSAIPCSTLSPAQIQQAISTGMTYPPDACGMGLCVPIPPPPAPPPPPPPPSGGSNPNEGCPEAPWC